MHLQTAIPECHLRPWQIEDKQALLLHANNRSIWRNLIDMFPNPYTEADADWWLSFTATPGPDIHFAIELHGQAVGGIGVIVGEGIRRYTGQFGFWLGEANWGHGVATAAANTMAHYALGQSQFARLEAPVIAWNVASMRVLEKVGFLREGVLRKSVFKDGQLTDSVMYALVRDV